MNDATLIWQSIAIQTGLTLMAFIGAIQWIALRHEFAGLAWPVGLRHRRMGRLVAILLMAGSILAGGALVASAIRPLPAPLSILALAGGGALALPVSISGAAIRHHLEISRRCTPHLQSQRVDLGPVQAAFYSPSGQGPFPTVCLIPDPASPQDEPTALIQALTQQGISVLALDRHALEAADRLTLQGFVALGISRLAQWPETRAGLVGLVGLGVGGDLALRSAAMDPGVAAALAIEPVLSPHRPLYGANALRALSWFAAQRRAHRWRHSPLVKELDALAAVRAIAPRPVAIVVESDGEPTTIGNLDILRAGGGCALVPAAHPSAARQAAQWLAEHLR